MQIVWRLFVEHFFLTTGAGILSTIAFAQGGMLFLILWLITQPFVEILVAYILLHLFPRLAA